MTPKTVYRGNDTLFYNSQCLFVEYHDVLSMPWYTMLWFTKNSNAFKDLFKINEMNYGYKKINDNLYNTFLTIDKFALAIIGICVVIGVVGSVAVGTAGTLLTEILELPLQHTFIFLLIPMSA